MGPTVIERYCPQLSCEYSQHGKKTNKKTSSMVKNNFKPFKNEIFKI